MRILLIINSIRISGTEKLMIALAKELTPKGCEFWILPLVTPFDEEFKRSLESDGFKLNILLPKILLRFDNLIWRINGLTTRLFKWSFRDWYLVRHLLRECKKLGIQIVVSNSYTTDLFYAKAHERSGLPLIVVEHGAYSYAMVDNEHLNPAAIERSRTVVAVSKWCNQMMASRYKGKKIVTIYNAAVPILPYKDILTHQLQADPNKFTFSMHGRDIDQKGWDVAIESFLKLKEKGYDARLVLMCSGPYIESLQAKYREHNDIVFTGFMYDVAGAISLVDAGLVLSKRYEAFGLTILDYIQKGKPVIASRVGAIPEVVEVNDRKGGILVDTDNGIPRVNEVVEAMQKLIDNKEVYSQLSADGPLIARRFSIETCADSYLKLFKSVIKDELR